MPAAPVPGGSARGQGPAVAYSRSALMPILLVGAGLGLLLIVAVVGYFFVYPRLTGGEAQTVTNAQLSESAPGSPTPSESADSANSASSAAPGPSPEAESSAGESTAVREPESTTEFPTGETTETTSSSQAPTVRSRASKGSSSPVSTSRSTPVDAPVSPAPEPVSSPPVATSEPGTTPPVSEAAVEPVAELSDRSPSPVQEETEPSEASATRQSPVQQKPVYEGPKRGVLIWTGEADKGMTVVIDGNSANIGQVQGALPGVACMVRLSAANVAVSEAPGPRNGYRRISLRFNKKGRVSVPVEWEVLN